MARKKTFDQEEITDTSGPMNSVSKDDSIVWAHQKIGIDYDEKQIKRISQAKKKKAKNSSKKHDRQMNKQILKNYKEQLWTIVKQTKTVKI